MRNAFARTLTRLAQEDPRVVLLSGDIGNRLFDPFKAVAPERFFNCGVAEANMTGMAAGMAMMGLRPFSYTIAAFVTTRCLEQIRVDVCYHRQPVTIVGVGAGLSYASLGATHHACEDIALLRALPEMQVICPADAFEVEAALEAVLAQDRPAYIRLGKKNEPLIHAARPAFTIGQALPLRAGRDLCLLACGTHTVQALEACEILAERGISAAVYSFHTVKPLDLDCLRAVFSQYPLVATIEEHSLIGGFGAAVAEWLVDQPARPQARLLRFGTPDHFPHTAVRRQDLWQAWGLTAAQMAETLARTLA